MADKQSVAVACMVILLVASFGQEVEAQNCIYVGPCETIVAFVSKAFVSLMVLTINIASVKFLGLII